MSDHQRKIGLIAGKPYRVVSAAISSQYAHVAARSGARPVQRSGGDERIIRPRVPDLSRRGRYDLSYRVIDRSADKEPRDNKTGHTVFDDVRKEKSRSRLPRVADRRVGYAGKQHSNRGLSTLAPCVSNGALKNRVNCWKI